MVQLDHDRAVGPDERGQVMVCLVIECHGRGLLRVPIARRLDDLLAAPRDRTVHEQIEIVHLAHARIAVHERYRSAAPFNTITSI